MFNEVEAARRASSTASSKKPAPRATPPPGSTGRNTTSPSRRSRSAWSCSSSPSACRASSCAILRSRARRKSSPTSAATAWTTTWRVPSARCSWATAFAEHAYKWPTIGWMKDIEGFTTDDCQAFYKTFYSPNNASVVVVGDFKELVMLEKISRAYGELPPSELPVEDYRPEPAQSGERRVELKKPTPTEKLDGRLSRARDRRQRVHRALAARGGAVRRPREPPAQEARA